MMNPTQPNHQLSPNWDRGEGTPGPCLRMGFSGQGPAARPPLPAAQAHALPQGPGHGPGSLAPGLEAPSSLGNVVVGEDRASRLSECAQEQMRRTPLADQLFHIYQEFLTLETGRGGEGGIRHDPRVPLPC